MAKKSFNFGESPVAKTSEDIRNADHKKSPAVPQVEQSPSVSVSPQQETIAPQPETTAAPASNMNASISKAKKTESGLVVNIPMADYVQLSIMKIQTGRTLKDLALQAIHEFVEKYKQ